MLPPESKTKILKKAGLTTESDLLFLVVSGELQVPVEFEVILPGTADDN